MDNWNSISTYFLRKQLAILYWTVYTDNPPILDTLSVVSNGEKSQDIKEYK